MPSTKRNPEDGMAGNCVGYQRKRKKLKKKTTKTMSSSISERKDYTCSLWSIVHPKIDSAFIQSMARSIIDDDESTDSTIVEKKKTVRKHLPSDLSIFLPRIVEFSLYMYERQCIFNGKETKNPVLQKFHFCNNYRECDRGTAYFRSQILHLHEDLTRRVETGKTNTDTNASHVAATATLSRKNWMEQVLFMSYVYRMCNRIESFTNVANPAGGIPRLGQFDGTFADYVLSFKNGNSVNSSSSSNTSKVNRKAPFFTQAHQTTNFTRYIEWCSTSDQSISKLSEEIIQAGNNLQSICGLISKSLSGVRDFFSWQIVCDLEESRCFGDSLRDDFCILGPGAKSGLNDIFGTDSNIRTKYSPLQLCSFLRDCLDPCLQLVGLTKMPLWRNRPCTLKIIEHALCEMNKFYRLDTNSSNLRTWKSRSWMDINHPCMMCGSKAKGEVRCDSCHTMFCSTCTKSWQCTSFCKLCKDFEAWSPS